jgi:flagellar basal-body rod protein FlgG
MMADTLAIAARSMTDDIARMAAISHNLANAATPGFKRELMVSRPFVNFVQGTVLSGEGALAVRRPGSPGPRTDHGAGPMQYTGHGLDLAIEGEGFFEIDDVKGPLYTRQGNFQLDGNGRLVDHAGRAVLGSAGEIRIDSAAPRIDRQGRVYDGETLVGQLRIVRFDDPQAMSRLGAGLSAAGPQEAQPIADPHLRQGYVEASNVVTANEMVQLIETMRHFESNQKLIQGYDDVLERAIRTLGDF